MEGGGLSVMMGSDTLMPMLRVDNWDLFKSPVLMMCVYQGRRKFTLIILYTICLHVYTCSPIAASMVICEL